MKLLQIGALLILSLVISFFVTGTPESGKIVSSNIGAFLSTIFTFLAGGISATILMLKTVRKPDEKDEADW